MRLENRAPDNKFSAGLIRERNHSKDEPSRKTNNTYDILIPIYNAYKYVKQCIDSVLKYTPPVHSVILLDDASTDSRILPLLRSYEQNYSQIKVFTNNKNLGFVLNVNRGFHISKNNIIILNSDTEVSPDWIESMERCLDSDSKIGIVCPLSNNATILSVPVMNSDNKLPDNLSIEDFSKLIHSCSQRSYPRIPTAVGFCMLITRSTIDKLGAFDEDFGMGYGEENDYSMRAWQNGVEVACCDQAYVHHYGEASFTQLPDIKDRRSKNKDLLSQKWPQYHQAIYDFCRLNPLREIQERISNAIFRYRYPQDKRPHILYVVHDFRLPGGTELHTRSLIRGLSSDFRTTLICPGPVPDLWTDMIEEYADVNFRALTIAQENVVSTEYLYFFPSALSSPIVKDNFARLVEANDYDIVHFQHLGNWASFYLPFIAKAAGKKVVLSIHDYYLLCPEYNLLKPDLTRCGKTWGGRKR